MDDTFHECIAEECARSHVYVEGACRYIESTRIYIDGIRRMYYSRVLEKARQQWTKLEPLGELARYL